MTTGEVPPAEGEQQSDGEAAAAVKDSARKATQRAKESATKAAGKTKATTGKAATAAKESAAKAAGTLRAARAARQGRVKDARDIASEADLGEGAATKSIAELEAMQYQVEVIKRGLSVSSLTKTC